MQLFNMSRPISLRCQLGLSLQHHEFLYLNFCYFSTLPFPPWPVTRPQAYSGSGAVASGGTLRRSATGNIRDTTWKPQRTMRLRPRCLLPKRGGSPSRDLPREIHHYAAAMQRVAAERKMDPKMVGVGQNLPVDRSRAGCPWRIAVFRAADKAAALNKPPPPGARDAPLVARAADMAPHERPRALIEVGDGPRDALRLRIAQPLQPCLKAAQALASLRTAAAIARRPSPA